MLRRDDEAQERGDGGGLYRKAHSAQSSPVGKLRGGGGRTRIGGVDAPSGANPGILPARGQIRAYDGRVSHCPSDRPPHVPLTAPLEPADPPGTRTVGDGRQQGARRHLARSTAPIPPRPCVVAEVRRVLRQP